MRIPLYNPDKDPVRSELGSLSKKLARTYGQETRKLSRSMETVAETEALHAALRCLRETKHAVDQVLRGREQPNPHTAAAFLEEQRELVQRVIQKEGLACHVRASQISIQTMNLLFLTQNEIADGLPVGRTPTPEKPVATQVSRATITSDLVYQAHHHLFPAEKMLVASGQRGDNEVKIGAVFEVTGDHSMGHVRADPSRLGRALISMELTDTHFAMWLHSHPGCGREATRPSTTDLKQHTDWLRDYSPNLISAIMVHDRWIRFWGTALDTGKVKIEISGPGITKEGEHGLYRLEQ
jgi:hypothetical protein